VLFVRVRDDLPAVVEDHEAGPGRPLVDRTDVCVCHWCGTPLGEQFTSIAALLVNNMVDHYKSYYYTRGQE
jgi:hypothetical protein